MNDGIRELLTENPMTFEGTRTWRRFFRAGDGQTSRNVNRIAIGVLAVLYAWLLLVILRFREDMSQMFLWFEMGALTLAVPASLYGAISQEREKQTWDSLLMTRLSPGQILVGKLQWRLLMVLGLMALFAVPTFLSHAVTRNRTDYTLGDLFAVQAILFAWSLFLAGFTLMVSAKTKRSITTLAMVVVALLSFLGLVPALFSLFTGANLTPVLGMYAGRDPYNSTWPRPGGTEPTPLLITGALTLSANPAIYLETVRVKQDYPSPTAVQNADAAVAAYGRNLFLAYLVGAWACVAGALRALRRMELPENDATRVAGPLAARLRPAAVGREEGGAHADRG